MRVLSTSKKAASLVCITASGWVTTATYFSSGMSTSLVNGRPRGFPTRRWRTAFAAIRPQGRYG